jgi:hypothetical protein
LPGRITEITKMARNADAMQIETGRERLIALFGLVPRESSCCSKLLGSLLTPPTVVEFEEGASVGNSPIPTNTVVVPLVLVVVVPVLLATVVAALVSVATLAVVEVTVVLVPEEEDAVLPLVVGEVAAVVVTIISSKTVIVLAPGVAATVATLMVEDVVHRPILETLTPLL